MCSCVCWVNIFLKLVRVGHTKILNVRGWDRRIIRIIVRRSFRFPNFAIFQIFAISQFRKFPNFAISANSANLTKIPNFPENPKFWQKSQKIPISGSGKPPKNPKNWEKPQKTQKVAVF